MTPCPICNCSTHLHDVVDFHKSCEEAKHRFAPLSGFPIYYVLCDGCGFCFSPQMCGWSAEEFRTRVYNDEYIQFDPDYLKVRPVGNAENLYNLFRSVSGHIRHLDYGGGDGLLSKTLRAHGWNSASWDPFTDERTDPQGLGTFNLITVFEVFEHVPDVHRLKRNLEQLLEPEGLLIFSTLISDSHIRRNSRLTWWYAAPRNGHISLFSKRSLSMLAERYGLKCGSFSDGVHLYFKTMPAFAQGILQDRGPRPAS